MKERLAARMDREGPITFEAFLETVLYDEREGYYRAGKVDRRDYCTSPEIAPLFARTIARYVEAFCESLGARSITILELGGASGRLASGLASALDHVCLDGYFIFDRCVERAFGPVQWIRSLDSVRLGGDALFVVANEFFDALPFHRVACRQGVVEEIYVGHGQGFFEEIGPVSGGLKAYLARYPVFLQDGQVSEVTNYGLPILERVSSLVEKGCFLIFDYGYHQAEIASGGFFEGSLLGYRSFGIRDDLFDNLGQIDITHHVNLDHLTAMLVDLRWRKEGEVDQWRFLQRAGMLELLAASSEKERLAAKWLINPEGLGSMISVLGFSKGLSIPMPGFGRS